MAFQAARLKGNLLLKDASLAFVVEDISARWLRVSFADAGPPPCDYGQLSEWPKLFIQVNDHEIELGPCRLDPEDRGENRRGKLIPLDESLDIERLLVDCIADRARSVFVNLPTLLAYKDEIEPSFREYTSDLIYDLSIYRKLFEDFDRELGDASSQVKDLALKAVLRTEGRKFFRFLDDKLDELSRVVAGFDRAQHRRHGYFFRRQLWDFILCSDLIARGNLKPRGYSGDSRMMSLIYANDYRGESTFAKLLFKHSAAHPASQAVRNRRDLIAKEIKEFGRRIQPGPDRKIKVLSVASGAATEMWDIFNTPGDCDGFEISLLDQDGLALAEARQTAEQVEKRLGRKITIDYLNYSVRTMLMAPGLKNGLGKYDFIYSMGLFDYLTPRVGRALMSRLCSILNDDGELLVGNFHVSNPSRHYMEYWVDWVLYYRTEEELRALVNGSPVRDVDVYFEDTRSQMFIRVRK